MTLKDVARLATQLRILTEPDPAERHPHILYVDHALHSEQHVYMVMTQIGQRDRADALDLLTNNADLHDWSADSIVREVVRPVLSALSHLHARGFAHRNVKTENVLIEYRELANNESRVQVTNVQLTGFGFCCSAVADPDPVLADAGLVGSPGFIDPEVMVRPVHDKVKSDVWSCACMLLELIKGRRWFRHEWQELFRQWWPRNALALDDHEQFTNLLDQKIADVYSACQTTQPRAAAVFRNALLLVPNARMTAEELLNELAELELDMQNQTGTRANPQIEDTINLPMVGGVIGGA
eukprot:CAMPEP_0205903854 /NCGR_PEP_ID=MMETSP1325-20131115/357_1 /ASSEMBLY_ACC=CAM_ASM_000708 /TAXON_ID=236786 /ORGANISM="Florenciella sp., Strain RCC1007" /LENGTH=295 /DNA_ID=CAMNT_0053269551 /DNA_START=21 /DNA_END=905 /DNA_ORIENTATION=+